MLNLAGVKLLPAGLNKYVPITAAKTHQYRWVLISVTCDLLLPTCYCYKCREVGKNLVRKSLGNKFHGLLPDVAMACERANKPCSGITDTARKRYPL